MARRRTPVLALLIVVVTSVAVTGLAWWLAESPWWMLTGALVLAIGLGFCLNLYLRPRVGEDNIELAERADEALLGISLLARDPAAGADTFCYSAHLGAHASRDTLVDALVTLHRDQRKGRVDRAVALQRRGDLEQQVECLEDLFDSLDELISERHWLESSARSRSQVTTAARVAAERTANTLEEAKRRTEHHRAMRRGIEEADDPELELAIRNALASAGVPDVRNADGLTGVPR